LACDSCCAVELDVHDDFSNWHDDVQGEFEDVRIKRISTTQIAERRRMFDNFSHLHDQFKRESDHEAVRYLQETMDLWEDQLIQQHDKDATISSNWTAMQKMSLRWANELANSLNEIQVLAAEDGEEDIQQSDSYLLDSCESLCAALDEQFQTSVGNENIDSSLSSRSTLGLKYDSGTLAVVSLEVGGPAFNCGQLQKGDVLLKVNDESVAPRNVAKLLKGDDQSGSTMRLSFRCVETNTIKNVTLTRMPTGVLGDSQFLTLFPLLVFVRAYLRIILICFFVQVCVCLSFLRA
jgi:hypothetical protein